MQTENTTERKLPQLQLPFLIEEEIRKAKALFKEKYALDTELHRSAIDPALPYPINWWDLMAYDLYREWQELEAGHYDSCTCQQMSWEREDYLNSEEAQRHREEQAAEELALEGYLQKVRSCSGKETLLDENVCIPFLGGIGEREIKCEVLRLSMKFGYPCPLTEQDLLMASRLGGEIENSHPAFIKYAADLLPDQSVEAATLLDWEYEQAEKYLERFVPKGYYIGMEPDFGWGVFRHGAFDEGDY